MPQRPVVIVSACRTAIGKFGGSLMPVSPATLGSIVIKETIARLGLESNEVNEVILGCVLTAGQGMNVARQSALYANLPESICAYTVNKVCGSGLKAILLGVQSIAMGEANIIVAGGVENMSQAPYLIRDARWGIRSGHSEIVDSLLYDGLWDVFCHCHMGETAENIAEEFKISRLEQDEFAAESQRKYYQAEQLGKFSKEIVPVFVPQKKGEPIKFAKDEFPHPETTVEALSKLPPIFKKDGTITAGNSCGINDGAAAVVLMSEEMAFKRGIPVQGRLITSASAGISPLRMGLGPMSAIEKTLAKAGISIKDIDLFEINEAFAAQTIAVIRCLKIDRERLNIYGGAIALGHPIGASGARVLVTLLSAMADRDCHRGLASLCIGGGMGIAVLIERVED